MGIKALRKVSYGLYVVNSYRGDKMNGQIANTVFQVTSEPPEVAVCLNKKNLTHEYVKESGVFSVSVLSVNATMEYIGRFGFKSGRDFDKFNGIDYRKGETGAPIPLEYAVAWFEAKVVGTMETGTHTLFIGEVLNGEILSEEEPMTYAIYHKVKKGKSPENAPTFGLDVEEEKKTGGLKRYRCKVCGYIYEPEKGDPDSGIKPVTPFEELPDDWTCPICGAGKEDFVISGDGG